MTRWAIQVEPGKPFTHRLDKAQGWLHISKATLFYVSPTLEESVVQFNVGDAESSTSTPVQLCTLIPYEKDSCPLDLEFGDQEKYYDVVVFSVLGPNVVRLSGIYLGNGPSAENVVIGKKKGGDDAIIQDAEAERHPRHSPSTTSNCQHKVQSRNEQPKRKRARAGKGGTSRVCSPSPYPIEEANPEQEPGPTPSGGSPHQSSPPPSSKPGCPQDDSVINTYHHHIAHKLWVGEERDPMVMEAHNYRAKLLQWPPNKTPSYVLSILDNTGLIHLVEHAYDTVDRPLVAAFVERWFPEGNSDHFRWGEMTITAYDVEVILGISVVGRPIWGTRGVLSLKEKVDLLKTCLGVSNADAVKFMKNRNEVMLKWLKDTFSEFGEDASMAKRPQVIRAYILYVIGSVLFPNKSRNGVPVKFLECLRDIEDIPKYSWGSAVIVHLYRQLGAASRFETKTISGCLFLMQAWLYEHFPYLERAKIRAGYVEGQPRIKKWEPTLPPGSYEDALHHLRVYFDRISPNHVVFDPFRDLRLHYPIPNVAFYRGLLVCFDMAEPYYPDRVLRQFGKRQCIPKMPRYRVCSRSGSSAIQYKVGYYACPIAFSRWQDHLSDDAHKAVEACHPFDCVEQYMQWYNLISHWRITPPEGSVAEATPTMDDMSGSLGNRLKGKARKLFCMAASTPNCEVI